MGARSLKIFSIMFLFKQSPSSYKNIDGDYILFLKGSGQIETPSLIKAERYILQFIKFGLSDLIVVLTIYNYQQ